MLKTIIFNLKIIILILLGNSGSYRVNYARRRILYFNKSFEGVRSKHKMTNTNSTIDRYYINVTLLLSLRLLCALICT